jgi:MYXO-CTERM domain-containing protein
MSAGRRTRSARLPLLIAAIGVALLIFMVTTEGEPGALPLGLIVLGVVGHLVARRRARPPRT